MNTKIILFDIDGVIVRPPYYFGKVLEDAGYIDAETILNNFFVHENTDCTEGRADISEKVVPYLEKIGWKESVEAFFTQQFEFESQYFDKTFIEIVKNLQAQDIQCYIASAQESVRAKYFLEEVGFNKIFDGHYISCNVGSRKDKLKYWEIVFSDLQSKYPNIIKEEITFFDDGIKNIEMAQSFGIQAFLFTDIEGFYRDLEILNI